MTATNRRQGRLDIYDRGFAGKQITLCPIFRLITAVTREDESVPCAPESGVGVSFLEGRARVDGSETMTASGMVTRTDTRKAPSRIRTGSCTFCDNGFSVNKIGSW